MLDQYKREINYLRISVTDKCNLRCAYCMPKDGIKLKSHSDILSYEEIEDIVRAAVKLGFRKFRLTGGEPLIRKNIIYLVEKLAEVKGVETLAMTTNGILLPKYAKTLKEAGLTRLNISLDSLRKDRHKKITRIGNLSESLAGIDAAREAGFEKTKLNVVLIEGVNYDEKEDFKRFAAEKNLEVRFIKKMSLKEGHFYKVEGGDGGACAICNRMRLTADGKIRPCLFSDAEFDIRALGAEKGLKEAISCKPEKGNKVITREMYQIGA